MSLALEDHVAVVTGASRGIGAAIARAFVREGARVAICAREAAALEALAAEAPGRYLPVACHVGRADDIRRLADTVNARWGAPGILVNNAATNIQQGPCLEATDEQFDKMVDVNLKSVFRLTREFAPAMCIQGRGSIINIVSVAGIRPQRESLLYSMTKAGLAMMTKSYALELGPRGVRVNAIAPGLVKTKLSEYFWKDEARLQQNFGSQPLAHLGRPEEMAEVAVLLASERGSYITGEVIVADGGFLLT